MYTVYDLIRYLSHLDPNTRVVLAKDSEGSEYSPIGEVDTGKYDSYAESGPYAFVSVMDNNFRESEGDFSVVLFPLR